MYFQTVVQTSVKAAETTKAWTSEIEPAGITCLFPAAFSRTMTCNRGQDVAMYSRFNVYYVLVQSHMSLEWVLIYTRRQCATQAGSCFPFAEII